MPRVAPHTRMGGPCWSSNRFVVFLDDASFKPQGPSTQMTGLSAQMLKPQCFLVPKTQRYLATRTLKVRWSLSILTWVINRNACLETSHATRKHALRTVRVPRRVSFLVVRDSLIP